MPKACRVKVLTKRPRKRGGFCGKKGKKDVNKDVNNVNSDDVNIENSIVNMLACPSCKAVNMKVSEIYSKKKGLASFLFFQCHSCNYFIESYTSTVSW